MTRALLSPEIFLLLLDGGTASRLGGLDKAFLAVGGVPIAKRILDGIGPLFPRTLVSTGRPGPWHGLGLEAVPDEFPGLGPLAGIHAGLEAVARLGGRAAFVSACDLPFPSAAVVERIAGRFLRARPHAAVARIAGRLEPVFACYSISCAWAAAACLREGRPAMSRMVESLPSVEFVDEGDFDGIPGWQRSFRNVNTPEDLVAAEEEAGRESPSG